MSTNYYTPIGGLGLHNLGALADNGTTSPSPAALDPQLRRQATTSMVIWGTVASVSGGASAYHGYKRSRGSVGAAVGWGLLGFIFPVITPAIALAQGFGKPKVSRNRRRRRRTSRRR
jgi:hypothetical protein